MSATNYDGKGDREYVESRLDDLTTPETPSAADIERHYEFKDTREYIETADAPDTVEITVDGETVTLDPPPTGVGKYRPLSDVIRADERGENDKQLLAVMDMTDRLIEASPDAYGRAFWDGKDEQTVIDAYGAWLRTGTAGNA